MAENNANDPVTTLAVGIGAGDLALTLSSVAGTGPNPFPAAPFRIRIDNELILVGARVGTACSALTRGAESTIAAAHAVGATVRQILTVAGLADAITSGAAGITQLTGDVTAGPGSGAQVATLANTAVTPGTYGDATTVAQITVDQKGRITAAADVPISGSGGAPTTSTYLTEDDETGDLPNSRQLLAGTNITFDDTTPGERTINASTGSGDPFLIVFSIGDGATPLTTGFKLFSNAAVRAGTITSALLTADVSGDITLDVLKTDVGSYPTTASIVASAPPELSTADLSLDSTLMGWDTAVAVDDIFGFEITAVDGVIAQITLTLQVVP